MVTLRPGIFSGFDNIVCGFSTIIDEGAEAPFYFNQSLSVGDDRRKSFIKQEKMGKESEDKTGKLCNTETSSRR